MIRFHKEMIKIHKESKELLTGSLKYLIGEYNIMGYGRFNRQSQTVVVVNNNDHEVTREISVWHLGIPKESVMKRLMLTYKDGFTTEAQDYVVKAGKLTLTLPPTSAIVLRHTKEQLTEKSESETESFLEAAFLKKFLAF